MKSDLRTPEIHFWENRNFLPPKLAFLHTKWAKMGSIRGSRGLILGFWGPQTLREAKLCKNFFEKNFGLFWPKNRPKEAKMGQVGFWGPFLALLGPFLTPLGLSVGPNVYILCFWRDQNHLEPNEKWSEDPRNAILYENTFLRKRNFWPQIWPFCPRNGPKWGPLGGLQGQFFVFLRVPDPLGVEIMQFFWENHFGLFWPKRTGLPPQKNRPK